MCKEFSIELEVINLISEYLVQHYNKNEIDIINKELALITEKNIESERLSQKTEKKIISYQNLQNILSTYNEKLSSRRKNGVYYTENDITSFILQNCLKLKLKGKLKNLSENIITDEDKRRILFFSILDPTCGCGAFLLTGLEFKIKIINELSDNTIKIKSILETFYGNDIDGSSIFITKIRLFLCILEKFGINQTKGIAKILNKNFSHEDVLTLKLNKKFDLVVGNPPYVETSKTNIDCTEKYGNIYANVLSVSLNFLNESGTYGFIIPVSYISTPRMAKIRDRISIVLSTQLILSYADRPGCLFTSVHQKLNVLIGSKIGNEGIFTGNYQYWYKEERQRLFNNISYVLNNYKQIEFIPKFGNTNDIAIYNKINLQENTLDSFMEKSGCCLFLNMRACFWIKAFLTEHSSGEYKKIFCKTESSRDYVYCILNSSIFWWYWICISDCWHLTNKEFKYFKMPAIFNAERIYNLAHNLEDKLESTKKWVGTKQTDYEYKHKYCLAEIHAIDDYVNNLFGLTETESLYIKNFSISYRTSEGAKV